MITIVDIRVPAAIQKVSLTFPAGKAEAPSAPQTPVISQELEDASLSRPTSPGIVVEKDHSRPSTPVLVSRVPIEPVSAPRPQLLSPTLPAIALKHDPDAPTFAPLDSVPDKPSGHTITRTTTPPYILMPTTAPAPSVPINEVDIEPLDSAAPAVPATPAPVPTPSTTSRPSTPTTTNLASITASDSQSSLRSRISDTSLVSSVGAALSREGSLSNNLLAKKPVLLLRGATPVPKVSLYFQYQ